MTEESRWWGIRRDCHASLAMTWGLPNSFTVGLDKSLHRPVVRPLYIGREIAGWQFARLFMINNALAANAFSGAWLVGAVALRFVLVDFAVSHIGYLISSDRTCDRAAARRWLFSEFRWYRRQRPSPSRPASSAPQDIPWNNRSRRVSAVPCP